MEEVYSLGRNPRMLNGRSVGQGVRDDKGEDRARLRYGKRIMLA